jgi:hypothetical protein
VHAIDRQPQRAPDGAPLHYERHRPEQTTLVEDMGQPYLAEPDADGEESRTLRSLQAAAITYRIAWAACRARSSGFTLR